MMNQTRSELEVLGHKLMAKVPPGHVDYISKDDAGRWALRLADEMPTYATGEEEDQLGSTCKDSLHVA